MFWKPHNTCTNFSITAFWQTRPVSVAQKYFLVPRIWIHIWGELGTWSATWKSLWLPRLKANEKRITNLDISSIISFQRGGRWVGVLKKPIREWSFEYVSAPPLLFLLSWFWQTFADKTETLTQPYWGKIVIIVELVSRAPWKISPRFQIRLQIIWKII